MSPENGEAIRLYIWQNRGAYTREAVTAQLRASGHSDEAIAAAWQDINSGAWLPPGASPTGAGAAAPPTPARQAGVARSSLFWLTLIGFIVVSWGLPILLFVLSSVLNDRNGVLALAGTLLYLLFQVAALVAGLVLYLTNRNRPVGAGLLIALLILDVILPVVAFVIVAGICIVFIAANSANTGR